MTRTHKIGLLLAWFVALALFATVALIGAEQSAKSPLNPRSITHFGTDDSTTVQYGNVAFPQRRTPFSSAYGWNWDHPVRVYDATHNSKWDVADAVNRWSIQGLSVVLTSDPNAADITVNQGDANAMCSTTAIIIGCADTVVVNGEPVRGTITMNSQFADWPYLDTLAGGTMHELGHTLGYAHAPVPNSDSVMGVPIPANGGARTTLSSYDRSGVRYLY